MQIRIKRVKYYVHDRARIEQMSITPRFYGSNASEPWASVLFVGGLNACVDTMDYLSGLWERPGKCLPESRVANAKASRRPTK